MAELESKYIAKNVEKKWYEQWLSKNAFHSVPDERKPYTIVFHLLMLQAYFTWDTC